MKTIKELLRDQNATVVDVRSEEEFNLSHHPGAINIPLDQVQQRADELGSMSKPLILYCRSGNRSGIAQAILKQLGVLEVYNGGGLEDMAQSLKN
ncbi:rhodanese-like domain-containing protein [Flavihumibacter sp.]|uniref:rhodanese-like domain-containing protein n=1 Tax=Flavihumibacter sp. TaxID=1913981 RepID=UPI002FC83470